MRPRRLELDGFSTFRERVVLDFSGLDLVAFTGSTGAGKSTLIDAITFALYGSVARYENTGRVAPVIHQLSTQARVRLDFETGGRLYTATRVVRRRSSKPGESDSASTREARLERAITDDLDGDTEVLAGDVKELNATVEELLGLDFKQFTRTIVLPQGEFASFLRDEPANRDKLLQRLLDLGIYERMGQRARSVAKTAADQARVLAAQQERHPALSDAEFGELGERLTRLEEVRTTVEVKLGLLADLDANLDPLRQRVTEIDGAIKRLELVDPPDDLPGLDRELANAIEQREQADADLVTARNTRDEALATVDSLGDKVQVAQTISLVEQLGDSEEKVAQLRSGADEVTEAIETLTADQKRVDAELEQAEGALRAARQAADAAGWTATLVVGEPCPVCHRDVDEVPDHDAAHEVDVASQHRQQLETESSSLAKQLAKTIGTQQAAVEEIERQGERIDLLRLQLSTFDGSVEPTDLAAVLETIEAAEGRHRNATDAVAAAESVVSERANAVAKIDVSLQEMRRSLGTLRDSLADLEPPSISHQSLVDDYDVIHRWAKDTAAALSDERSGLASDGKRIASERGELLAQLGVLVESVGTTVEPERMLQELSDATADAKAAVATAEQRRAEARELTEQIAALEEQRAVNDMLGKHLRSGGFGSWLLTEALDNIVAKATVWLLGLSNNQYSLVAGDKNFAIIDHNNADETRDVRTLSGGETFLASLALALALADSIAELAPVDSPRLESMFLDEGFGTLDPGTLDVVAGAIEELASTGRMIGIVTHVNDLAERMPARFEVTKGPSTSTVQLVEA